MLTYTPGPWLCDGTKVMIPAGTFAGVQAGAPMDMTKYSPDNPEGDAFLISIAPDLLNALVGCVAMRIERMAAAESDNYPRLTMAIMAESAAHKAAIDLINRAKKHVRIPGVIQEGSDVL